jgi:dTDP-4-amino-4,6-dideoxygalactose transaminase
LEEIKSPHGVIRLSKSSLSLLEKNAVMSVLDREFLGMGREVQEFEQILETYLNRQVVAVASGTAALHLALEALNVGIGMEVLVPSLTYLASFQAISATGATPVACDILEDTLNLDVRDAEKKITNKTVAIMPVHYRGVPCDMEEVYKLAKKYSLKVVEDAAHAFGTSYNGRLIGSDDKSVTCFSFDGIKNITSGEGGGIVTNDVNVLKKVRDSRLLGVKNDSDQRYLGKRTWTFDVMSQGWRYHMSNIMAAIGIEQFKRFDSFKAKRRKIALQYDASFQGNNHIHTYSINYSDVVPHLYVIRIRNLQQRDLLREELLKYGIETGVHYYPNHLLSLYKKKEEKLKITEKIYPEILSLPIHPDINDIEVDYIAQTINSLIYKYIR